MSEDLQHRAYRDGDERQIQELFRASYGGRELTLDGWYWRFRDNPAGRGLIELSWSGDVLAAHYAVTAMSMRIDGEDRMGALSGTTMTHPDYRGQGLFQLLARRTYERMTSDEMAIVWGFPNRQSHRGFVRDLAWRDLYQMPTLRSPVAAGAKLPDRAAEVTELTATDERFDRLWARVRDEYRVSGRRDAAALRWRYLQHPTEHYRLAAYLDGKDVAGYVAFKQYASELQIIDVLVSRSAAEVGDALVTHVFHEATAAGLTGIALWLRVDHPLHHALEKRGFVPEGPVTYTGGLPLIPSLDAVLSDVRGWYFTMGDSDAY